MKKIKVFLALIFSLACMFSLVACGGKAGYYVEDSLDVEVSYYTYDGGHAAAMVEFQAFLPDAAVYEVSYTLEMYYLGERIKSERLTSTCKSGGNETVDVSEYWTVEYSASNVSSYNFEVYISNVIAKTKASGLSEYSGLSIGFGVVGGLILVGLIVLYIYLKKQDNKQQAA